MRAGIVQTQDFVSFVLNYSFGVNFNFVVFAILIVLFQRGFFKGFVFNVIDWDILSAKLLNGFFFWQSTRTVLKWSEYGCGVVFQRYKHLMLFKLS